MVIVGSVFHVFWVVHTDNVVGPSWGTFRIRNYSKCLTATISPILHSVDELKSWSTLLKKRTEWWWCFLKTWSTQTPSLPDSVSSQWVPLLGESPPTHLFNHEINYNQSVPSYIISNLWYQYHVYFSIFQPVQWLPLSGESKPPLTTLYLFWSFCHRFKIIGSPTRALLPCRLAFCMVVPKIEKGFFKHMSAEWGM